MDEKTFIVEINRDAPVWGTLVIRDAKGSLKYFHEGDKEKSVELSVVMMDSINPLVIESIIAQATILCKMNYAELTSY